MYENSHTNSMTDGTDHRQMPFVHFLAGLGRLHLTLKALVHKCVAAPEIDEA